MAIRVYALHNRDPVVLWALGVHIALSVLVYLTLVCIFFVTRADGYSFNALC